MKTYNVMIGPDKSDVKSDETHLVSVKARSVKSPDWIQLIVHRHAKEDHSIIDTYVVTEVTTGWAVCTGPTVKDAIDRTLERIEKVGKKKVLATIRRIIKRYGKANEPNEHLE